MPLLQLDKHLLLDLVLETEILHLGALSSEHLAYYGKLLGSLKFVLEQRRVSRDGQV